MKLRINYSYIAALSVSIIAALLIGAVVLLISGYDPLAAYSAMLSGAFSNARHIGDVLEYAMVLCLCGVACDIGSRVGIFNVGGEGQLLLGAIVAAQIGVVLNGLSPWIVIPVAALGAAVTGGIYALIPGWLKVRHRVNEVITTIMLNNIAEFVCEFLAKGPWKNPDNNIVAGTGNLPQTYWFTKLATGSNLTTVFFVATGMTILTWYIMQRTSTGYEMRLTGDNPRFARFTGIKTDKVVLIAMIVSGMMCGLVGMFRVYGAEHIYKASISNDYYFEGLMVAMIAKYQVLPTAVISVLCGMLCRLSGAYLSLGYLNGTFVEGMSASRGFIAFACVIFAAANPAKAYLAALMFGFFDAIGLRLQNYISSDLTSAIPYAITIIMMVYVVVSKERRRRSLAPKHEPAAPEAPAPGAGG
uniref:ABC transporter permease n=1 Tax=Candidatus Scatomorpha intestinigallinarum TaxID=2840923 RepID=UPI0040274228